MPLSTGIGISPVFLGNPQSYINLILGLFSNNIIGYWPLDETSGTTAFDRSSNSYNGATNGAIVGQPGAPGKGLAYLFDGVNDFVNATPNPELFTALGTLSEGSVMAWGRISDAAVWTDGLIRYVFFARVGTTEVISIRRETTNNTIRFFRQTGVGGVKNIDSTVGPSTDWVHYAMTWSIAAGELIAYVDGVQVGAAVAITTPATPDANQNANIGNRISISFWSGLIQHTVLLNRPATPAEIAEAAR